MKLLSGIYTVTLYQNGSFCWSVERREKTREDYKSDFNWLLIFCAVGIAPLLFQAFIN